MPQDIQSESPKSVVKPQVSAIEYNDPLPDNRLLLAMYHRVEDISQRLQHVQEILEQAQDEVESVASDVENIDEKIEDVEINTNTITSISQNKYETTKTVEQLVYFGTIAIVVAGVLAKTFKYVHWRNKNEFDYESKPRDPFDIPTANPDLFGM